MNKNMIIVKEYERVVSISHEQKCLYTYKYFGTKIIKSSRGTLLGTNPEIAKKLESHFDIVLKDYGVEILDECITYTFENEE